MTPTTAPAGVPGPAARPARTRRGTTGPASGATPAGRHRAIPPALTCAPAAPGARLSGPRMRRTTGMATAAAVPSAVAGSARQPTICGADSGCWGLAGAAPVPSAGSNGASPNGGGLNGRGANGAGSNGYGSNGRGASGRGANAGDANGAGSNGLRSNRARSNGAGGVRPLSALPDEDGWGEPRGHRGPRTTGADGATGADGVIGRAAARGGHRDRGAVGSRRAGARAAGARAAGPRADGLSDDEPRTGGFRALGLRGTEAMRAMRRMAPGAAAAAAAYPGPAATASAATGSAATGSAAPAHGRRCASSPMTSGPTERALAAAPDPGSRTGPTSAAAAATAAAAAGAAVAAAAAGDGPDPRSRGERFKDWLLYGSWWRHWTWKKVLPGPVRRLRRLRAAGDLGIAVAYSR